MEEMNKEIMDTTVTEVVEEATKKLTFKENVYAYALAGVFVTGLATIGYLGYKGTKKIGSKLMSKREQKVELEQCEAVDVEDENIQEVDED